MALSWLKNFVSNGKVKSFDTVQASDEKLCNKVELCVKSGRYLIIKDCNGLEPYLYPLLRNEICYKDSRYLVTVGGKRVNYNENFKLFLVSKRPCTNIAAGIVRIVDFSLTRNGLENRLLSILIDFARPNLEDELRNLTEVEGESSLKLSKMETKLLTMLCDSKEDLLENEELIDTLVNIRENAKEISRSLAEINRSKESIRQHYEEWISVAKAGSNLYFLLNQMHVVGFVRLFSFVLRAMLFSL